MLKNNKIVFVIIVVALFIGGYFVLGKSNNSNQANLNGTIKQGGSKEVKQAKFNGEQGESVAIVNGQVELEESTFDGATANFYNTKLESGKTIYYFVLRDKQGNFRVAANACQVCFGARKGFTQKGDVMVCNNCGVSYPLNKIATEKGGCNPGPINSNLTVINGKVIIDASDFQDVTNLF